MVRAWTENSFADNVLPICCTAALASALIPGCVGLAGSAARAAGVRPGIRKTSPKANTPAAAMTYRDSMIASKDRRGAECTDVKLSHQSARPTLAKSKIHFNLK